MHGRVWELQIGVQDAAFLPSRANFFTTFLENCGRGEYLGATACLKTVVGVSRGMLPVKYFCSNEAFLCRLNFVEIIRITKLGRIWSPSVLLILQDLRQWFLVPIGMDGSTFVKWYSGADHPYTWPFFTAPKFLTYILRRTNLSGAYWSSD